MKFLILFFLLAQANAYFPMGKCYDKSCSFTPLKIQIYHNVGSKMCFNLVAKNCTDSKYNCCKKYTDKIQKIVFKSHPKYKYAVESVTLNNNKKGGGIYFDVYGDNKQYGELRITNLLMTYEKALTVDFCINFKNGITFNEFCGNSCQYTIFDPFEHSCCPTCNLDFDEPPPPPGQCGCEEECPAGEIHEYEKYI